MSLSNQTFELFDNESKPHSRSYGFWTTRWWVWALSTPKKINPVVDEDGKNWNINQPSSNVWFLAGRFGRADKKYPHRKVSVPNGRSLLFPVLNCEANSLEYPDLTTNEDLINHVIHDVNTVVKKDCYINGVKIEPTRIASDPALFPVNISDDNFFGIKGGKTTAAADGYWVFLKSLPKGTYSICFEGSCEFGILNAGADYDLKII